MPLPVTRAIRYEVISTHPLAFIEEQRLRRSLKVIIDIIESEYGLYEFGRNNNLVYLTRQRARYIVSDVEGYILEAFDNKKRGGMLISLEKKRGLTDVLTQIINNRKLYE